MVENEKNKLGSLDHTQEASQVRNVDHGSGVGRGGLEASATLTCNFVLGRATSLDAYGVAIGVFGRGKLAPTGRWLRNRLGGDEEARWQYGNELVR